MENKLLILLFTVLIATAMAALYWAAKRMYDNKMLPDKPKKCLCPCPCDSVKNDDGTVIITPNMLAPQNYPF